jgi:hypothetical protein
MGCGVVCSGAMRCLNTSSMRMTRLRSAACVLLLHINMPHTISTSLPPSIHPSPTLIKTKKTQPRNHTTQQNDRWHVNERRWGAVSRSVRLPKVHVCVCPLFGRLGGWEVVVLHYVI